MDQTSSDSSRCHSLPYQYVYSGAVSYKKEGTDTFKLVFPGIPKIEGDLDYVFGMN
jgi:hypothetical protein